MKTRQPDINRETLRAALNATSKQRMSVEILQEKEKILRTIQADAVMGQRWERYCKDNYYANDIRFDNIVDVLIDLVR